ncbi:MAG: type II toxin-antitoxin system Phd/YefM family antitoxin [Spirochaetes bacterium]|nr:type II toxin-antitoxin system Phd/YefM family antitoxin [Spirochaetota bacterium]
MKLISKSKLKPNLLKILRDIEKSGDDVIITDRGKPVLKITRYSEHTDDVLRFLKNSIKDYKKPTEPVGIDDWDILP